MLQLQLRKIVRSVRSSPQRRKAWLAEVAGSIHKVENAASNVALMLILNVKMQWSSTHQMLRNIFSGLVNLHYLTNWFQDEL